MLNEKILTPNDAAVLQQLVDNARRVVVTCHQGPDGDAMGSMSAMVQLLRHLGKEAHAVAPNAWPDNLGFTPLANEMLVFSEGAAQCVQVLNQADLVVCLDYNAIHRVGEPMAAALAACAAPRLMLDHHLEPEQQDFALCVSQPQMSSTCEVLLHVIEEMGWHEALNRDMASALYLGMMTDTGAFSYASSRSEVFRCVALLLDQGIDKDKIYRNIFWGASEARMRMTGYLLYVNMQLLPQYHTAIITLTTEEYRRFRLKNGDTEGIVNMPLQIAGIRLSIFLREDTEIKGKIKVSTRSVENVPCNLIAQDFFNGGGHKNAAGGSMMCSLEQAVEQAKRAVEKYAEDIKP